MTIYDGLMVREHNLELGQVLKQRRISLSMKIRELAVKSKISPSHLSRIEKGERFPSAQVLQRMARPLGFEEQELFILAGFLGQSSPKIADKDQLINSTNLDPYTASILANEPIEVQRAAVMVVSILKSLARNVPLR